MQELGNNENTGCGKGTPSCLARSVEREAQFFCRTKAVFLAIFESSASL